jgi:anti-sigma regulatory factor (Ser/Thr protein kinase)
MITAVEVAVVESTHVAEARRLAVRLAGQLGFEEAARGRLSVVVTEIASNILKHARGGKVVLSPVFHEEPPALDFYGFDQGPGMSNLNFCVRDGYSTAGSPGTGLGAIGRLADEWDVFTGAEQGTVIRARCRPAPGPVPGRAAAVEVGGLVLPLHGHPDSGDGWAVRREPREFSMVMVDGLGHGYGAALASKAAIDVFLRNPALHGAALLEEMHAAMRTTRGAAVAVVTASSVSGELRFAGVGNIAGVIWDGSASRHLVSMNGIVGHRLGKVREFVYPWKAGALLVLHSDGLRSRWNLGSYPGLQSKSPALIAGVLMRDGSRGTDDSSVAVAMERGTPHAA